MSGCKLLDNNSGRREATNSRIGPDQSIAVPTEWLMPKYNPPTDNLYSPKAVR